MLSRFMQMLFGTPRNGQESKEAREAGARDAEIVVGAYIEGFTAKAQAMFQDAAKSFKALPAPEPQDAEFEEKWEPEKIPSKGSETPQNESGKEIEDHIDVVGLADLEGLSRQELYQMAKDKGLEIEYKSATKESLIEALRG